MCSLVRGMKSGTNVMFDLLVTEQKKIYPMHLMFTEMDQRPDTLSHCDVLNITEHSLMLLVTLLLWHTMTSQDVHWGKGLLQICFAHQACCPCF